MFLEKKNLSQLKWWSLWTSPVFEQNSKYYCLQVYNRLHFSYAFTSHINLNIIVKVLGLIVKHFSELCYNAKVNICLLVCSIRRHCIFYTFHRNVRWSIQILDTYDLFQSLHKPLLHSLVALSLLPQPVFAVWLWSRLITL